jgi:M penetrans paralogue family 26
MENQKLPNATAVLVLGILSIITCCCYGVLGIILGTIALYLFSSDRKLYNSNPSAYTNYQNLNIGRILAIIGLVLSVLMLVFIVWLISIVGLENLNNEELMRLRIEHYFGN